MVLALSTTSIWNWRIKAAYDQLAQGDDGHGVFYFVYTENTRIMKVVSNFYLINSKHSQSKFIKTATDVRRSTAMKYVSRAKKKTPHNKVVINIFEQFRLIWYYRRADLNERWTQFSSKRRLTKEMRPIIKWTPQKIQWFLSTYHLMISIVWNYTGLRSIGFGGTKTQCEQRKKKRNTSLDRYSCFTLNTFIMYNDLFRRCFLFSNP